MKAELLLVADLFFFAAAAAPSRDQRVNLIPKLQPGQTLTYLIRYHSDKNVKTESSVAVPLAPTSSQIDAHGLLQVQILDLQLFGAKPVVHGRGQFLKAESYAPVANSTVKKPESPSQPLAPEGNPVEFTISPGGIAEKIAGLDALTSDQQQIWQEWLARFAMAWALSSPSARIGDKWKIEQPEQAASPVAALTWTRDSIYVRDEPCSPAQLSLTGEATPTNHPTETCAVLLTEAKLVQKSSPKDATPEDFKFHELKTMGTARGSNEIITYISLTTGLVVRATEQASQQMDVIVAKADGSNAVHYNVAAKSQLEVLLLTPAPSKH
ncbi:MAG TPA: hypothetical protein VNB49_18335 [Candidatus Dormibacteraeota bacterium]|nr:hypothetical protein [Candidatus Dormibacteraeota bacterium]